MKNYIKILIAITFMLAGCSQLDQKLDENIAQPVLKMEPKLIYPFTAQYNNSSGTSEIIFVISKEGKVTQTNIHKSSGFKDLDEAAVNYCKGLVFIPAKDHGVPISSKMRWEVQFNLKDLEKETQDRIATVKNLYLEIDQLEGPAKLAVQREILLRHNEIINEMRDGKKFNEYVYTVVQNNIKKEWKSVSGSAPLSFLLYYDFINRFEDYDSLGVVWSLLENAIKQDIDYLNVSGNFIDSDKTSKTVLIQKIKTFVENNYPNINLKDLNSGTFLKNNNLS